MVNILGANSVSGGYEIDNSLRFNDGDSAELTRTPSGEGNKQIHTISMWIKRCTIGTNQALFSAGPNDSNVYSIRFLDDSLYISQSSGFVKDTSRLFRDPSAWYHIVIAIDTTDGTQNNRIKVYINGVLETSFAENTFAGGQNLTTHVNDDVIHAVGYDTLNNSVPFDGYISEFHLIDGTQKAASDFGETDDNGVWIPKAYDGSYGTNGVYLEFKQTGTGTDASGMGADTSGNDNHFAPVNLAATDVTTDTPTNNFATLNPLHTEGTTFAEGNTDVLMSRSGAWNVAMGTMAIPNSGKWYMEIKITAINASAHNVIGFLDAEYPFMGSNDTATGFTGGGTSWLSLVYFHAANDNAYVNSADGSAYQFENNTTFNGSVNDIYSMAFDRDNNKVWFGLNGVYAKANGTTGANPSTGADATITDVSSSVTYMPQGASGSSSARQQWNFGNAPHAISSGNADANGYGNFEYAVPSGFYSLCTKNLAEFG